MLTLLPGGRILKTATVKYQWVEDLLFFDGPVLSYVRANSQQDYFYLWVDNDWQWNRWMAIPVTREMIRGYKLRTMSLLDLINQNKDVTFVDIADGMEIKRAFSLSTNDIPEDMLPESNSFFDPDFCPTGEDVLLDATSYYLGIDGNWFMEDFTNLQKRYGQLYAFIYTLMNLDRTSVIDNIKRIFAEGNWYGGFARVNFFNQLDRVIPSMHEPRVDAYHYASPGHLKLELWSEASEKLSAVAKTTLNDNVRVLELVDTINRFLRDKDLKSKGDISILTAEAREELFTLSDSLCKYLGIGEFETDFKLLVGGDPIRYSKILLSFERRLRDVLPFVERNMLKMKVEREDYSRYKIAQH